LSLQKFMKQILCPEDKVEGLLNHMSPEILPS
jgi:hypothetical protein